MKTFYLVNPEFFNVNYNINPWMNGNYHNVDNALAISQWNNLVLNIKNLGAEVKISNSNESIPDSVFTANAGLMVGNKIIISHFRNKERQPESEYYKQVFLEMGYEVDMFFVENNIYFEGTGDALYNEDKTQLFVGYGFRSDKRCLDYLTETLKGVEVVPLHLQNPQFYHLDTCFKPLPNKTVLFNSVALTPQSLKYIWDRFENLVFVTSEEASEFACNSVLIDNTIITNSKSWRLVNELEKYNIKVVNNDLSEFMKSGGSAACLTLEI